MRSLKFCTIMPDDNYFTWQCHLWLESLKNIGHSDKAIVLIFTPNSRPQRKDRFQKIIDLYPEAEFHFYKDEHDMSKLLGTYISVLRPYTAWRYWTDFPQRKNDAIFYCDSDILFLPEFNIDKFIDDDVNYLSDTNSYINASYFDSKIKDVIPEKLEEYKTIDVLNTAARLVGINRQICETNNSHSGGAQYLLKNIDAEYWKKVMDDCMNIIVYLGGVNKQYFANENKGFQKWCADMWSVLWNLWNRNAETRVVPELTFSWATDRIERINTTTIFHNAGISADQNGHPCFYKGKYHMGTDPTKDPHLDEVLNNEESKKWATWYYANELKKLSNKYKLSY